MKRFYLFNTLYLLLAIVLFAFFKNQAFLMSIFLRQDIPYFSIELPVYIGLALFGILYQAFKIDWKNWKSVWYGTLSIMTTLYIMFILVFQTRIHLTATPTAELILVLVPGVLIMSSLILTVIFDRNPKRVGNTYEKNVL